VKTVRPDPLDLETEITPEDARALDKFAVPGMDVFVPYPFPDLGRLAAIPEKRWSRLRLTLQPGCRLLRSPYPVQRIWQVNQPGYAGDVTVSLDEGEARVLISRAGYEVAVAAVRAGEYAFLEAAASGLELSRAVEAALAQDPALDVATLLRDLAAREIVVDFQ